MAELVPCKDCGYSISPSAGKCPDPECRSERPHGVYCSVCYGSDLRFDVPRSERISIKYECTQPRFSGSTTYYHTDCVKKLLTPPKSSVCPDCKTPLSEHWDWKKIFINFAPGRVDCPNCGSPYALKHKVARSSSGFCGYCALPLLQFHYVVSFNEIGYRGKHYHDSCGRKIRKQVEERQFMRRSELERRINKKGFGCSVLIVVLLFLALFAFFISS